MLLTYLYVISKEWKSSLLRIVATINSILAKASEMLSFLEHKMILLKFAYTIVHPNFLNSAINCMNNFFIKFCKYFKRAGSYSKDFGERNHLKKNQLRL